MAVESEQGLESSSVFCPHVQDLRLKGQRAAWVTAKMRATPGFFLLQYSIPTVWLPTPSSKPPLSFLISSALSSSDMGVFAVS